jgi:hypothetical protein
MGMELVWAVLCSCGNSKRKEKIPNTMPLCSTECLGISSTAIRAFSPIVLGSTRG